MTSRGRHVCDRPEPCGRYAVGYAAGRDKADFEVLASLDVLPHADGCACQPCQVKRACLQEPYPAGQDVARAIRPGGGLGVGGP